MFRKYKNDILLILILVLLIIIFTIAINIHKSKGDYVRITIDDEVYGSYSLSEDISINLPTGNTLVIENEEAYVSESNCKDQVCVEHTRISAEGENIICLPNKVIIEIYREVLDE